MSRSFITGVALTSVAVAAGLLYAYHQKDEAHTYITAPIERGKIVTVVRATGTLTPISMVDVSSELSGRMAEVLVGFNDAVHAGQVIARLDQRTFAAKVEQAEATLRIAGANVQVQRAALERAKAQLTSAQIARNVTGANQAALQAKLDETERQLQRKLTLTRSGSVSTADLGATQAQRDAQTADMLALSEQFKMKHEAIVIAEADIHMAEANLENAQAVVEQKRAELEEAEHDLARTELRAPIDGVIIKRDVNPGQIVAVSLEAKMLFNIANDLREMEVHGNIDEADIGQVKPGQKVTFTVDAHPNHLFEGRVRQVRMAHEVVQNVVTYTVVISAPNREQLLFPGMTANLRILINETDQILKIPNEALRFRPAGTEAVAPERSYGSATVWVIGPDRRPSGVPITVGRSHDNGTELLSGDLSEGQQVIVGIATVGEGRGPFGIRLGF